jgi:poly-gamma-glutamate synthesis protein (capsule biosynthesis protein)
MYKKIGADLWAIGNNHSMDAGKEGVISTRKIAEELGCKAFGAGLNEVEASEPIYLDEAGGIGMFGVSYMAECIPATDTEPGIFRWDDLDYIKERIDEIKAKCRWCVIVSHGGEEFTSLPSPYTRERYLKFLELGADVVVGHHPHVPENYELFDHGKAIFYSLGNFIFDTDYQRSQYNTEIGLIIKLNFTEDEFTWEPMGLRIDRENEHIIKDDLPRIFVDVKEEDYKLLSPLSAKMHIAATKRQMTYLKPEIFKDATEEQWAEHFREPLRTGRVPGETLDFFILCPLAEEAEKGLWKQSRLEDIKNYILEQM